MQCNHVVEENIVVVGYYVAGDMSQQWIIEKDQICFKSDRQLRVVVDGTVVVGARCQASHNDSSSSSSSSWLFDHQSVAHLSLNLLLYTVNHKKNVTFYFLL